MSEDIDQLIERFKQFWKEQGIDLDDREPMTPEEIIERSKQIIKECEEAQAVLSRSEDELFLEWLKKQGVHIKNIHAKALEEKHGEGV